MVRYSSAGAITGNTRRHLAIPSDTWQYQVVPDNTKRYLTIPSDTWQYQVVPDNTFIIRINTNNFKQYLIPNKLGIGLYHLVLTSSIVTNMIPILSWYCHNMVLKVLCLSGIVTILILAIFRRPSMLSKC